MHTKKREKENLITEISWFFFAIALTTKEEEENVEICKEKKNKNKKLKSRATHSHKPTKFLEQLKRIEREQFIEIKESQKRVLITQPQTNKIPWTIEADRERVQYIEIKERQKHVLITSK